jgi:hypothetical protein
MQKRYIFPEGRQTMIRNRHRNRPAAVALLLMMLLPGQSALTKPKEPILVLGFDTKLLNDVQERLLRESVMRQFHVSGYRIVPVMEIESIFHDGRERQVRKLDRVEIQGLCDEMRAGYACCGSMVPETVMVDETIKSGVTYICTITFFTREKNKFENVTIRVAGEDNLYQFYGTLSKKIVEEIGKLL